MPNYIKYFFSSSTMQSLIALLAGALMPLAFAPFHFYPLAIITPAILLAVWFGATPKQALWRGLFFGIGLFGVGVSWVFVSIHEFGNTSAVLAAVFTAGFVLILASFIALQGYLLTRFFSGNSKLLLAFPASWALFEWLRSWVLSGFPWLLVGYSQIKSPLSGFIPIIGEYGIAFLVTFSSALIVMAYRAGWRQSYKVLSVLAGIWLLGAGLTQCQWTQPVGKPLTVALIQGDISQQIKWQPHYLDQSLNTYLGLTQTYWGVDVIVWPESAIPASQQYMQEYLNGLSRVAKDRQSSLLVGIPSQVGDNKHYYNSVLGLGKAKGTYTKRHLVPFGEYLPFERWLRGLIAFFAIPMSDFIPGPIKQSLSAVAEIPVAIFICYEIAYPEVVRSNLPEAKLLATLSNDSWFGNSLAPWQHAEIGQFRSLQTGRDQLFASNSGVTAIIDNKGYVRAHIPQFVSKALTGSVQPRMGSTPWVWLGTTPIVMVLFILLLIARIIYRHSSKQRSH